MAPPPAPTLLAPIAVFAYRRAAHVRALLESLAANPEARDSEIFVFCDGARGPADAPDVQATRAAVRAFDALRLEVIEREHNEGLARSVIAGVSRLCHDFGRVIVLEDDLVVSRTFLAYMNDALDRYAADERVLHVSGYMFPVPLRADADAVFLPFTNSWGWGTWARAWRRFDPDASGAAALHADAALRARFDVGDSFPFFSMLLAQAEGKVDSWGIRWYLSVFMSGGLCLYPTRSLVANRGVGPLATHTTQDSELFGAVAHDLAIRRWPPPAVDARALAGIRRCFRRAHPPAPRWRRALRVLRRVLRRRDAGHGPGAPGAR